MHITRRRTSPRERALHAALTAVLDPEQLLAVREACEAHAVTLGHLHARYPSEEVDADAGRLRDFAALLSRAETSAHLRARGA